MVHLQSFSVLFFFQLIHRSQPIHKQYGFRANRWKKRGISAIPTMYGIGFSGGSLFLNQAGALLLVYVDGSVLLAHGGVEMGQGLHTKMIQVASRALGIPAESIHVKETSTDKVANASPTAGSFSSDLNGMAVLVSIYVHGNLDLFFEARKDDNLLCIGEATRIAHISLVCSCRGPWVYTILVFCSNLHTNYSFNTCLRPTPT